jgi:hypothetical protein
MTPESWLPTSQADRDLLVKQLGLIPAALLESFEAATFVEKWAVPV